MPASGPSSACRTPGRRRMLDAPVIIVSEGGIGRPIDEIVLNRALFAAQGVGVLGAVVNKVDVDSHPHLPEVLERGLAQHGIDLLGCIPYSAVPGQPFAGADRHAPRRASCWPARRRPARPSAGSRSARCRRVTRSSCSRDRTLLITPGDRDDLLRAAIEANRRARACRASSASSSPAGSGRPTGCSRSCATRGSSRTWSDRHVPHGAGGGRDPGEDARRRHREDRHDHRARRRGARRRSAPRRGCSATSAGNTKGGRTWAPAGLPCTGNVRRPEGRRRGDRPHHTGPDGARH